MQGDITRYEFRRDIRKTLERPDTLEVDALFDTLDEDHGGTLDAAELKAGIEKLRRAAERAASSASTRAGEAEAFRAKGLRAAQVADAIRQAEQAAQAVVAKEEPGVRAQIGAILLRKGTKPSLIMSEGCDLVDRAEFRKHVLAMGVSTDALAEVDTLFNSMDTDRGGTLDLREVSNAMSELYSEAERTRDAKRTRYEQVILSYRAARAAQAAWVSQSAAENAAAAEQAREAEDRAAELAAAAAEAKAARLVVLAEKRAAAAAAKANFVAKVEAKRQLVRSNTRPLQ